MTRADTVHSLLLLRDTSWESAMKIIISCSNPPSADFVDVEHEILRIVERSCDFSFRNESVETTPLILTIHSCISIDDLRTDEEAQGTLNLPPSSDIVKTCQTAKQRRALGTWKSSKKCKNLNYPTMRIDAYR
jgi:hypothetical protein